MPKVVKVVIWTNGMAMCFDKKGEQIPEIQGFILDVAEKLKEQCDENTKWQIGKWGEVLMDADFSWYWKREKVDGQGEVNG